MARSIEEIKAQLEMIETRIDAITGAPLPGQYSPDEIAQMYALDPNAAQFFVNKQAAEQTLKSRESIAALKLGDITKKDKLELQQLWKDNTRALEGARARGESQDIINAYAENIDRLVKQLQAIDPATWGESNDTGTGDISTSAIDAAKAEGGALIADAKDVKNDKGENKSDGFIDNISGIKASIRALKDKYKISDKDINDILLNLKDKEDEIDLSHKALKTEEDRMFQRGLQVQAADRSTGAIDERSAKKKIDALRNNPNSIPDRADAVLWLMRKASGAMIGPNEMLQYMQGKLPPAQYNALAADLSPTGMKAIIGIVTQKLTDAQISSLTNRYLNFIDVNKIIDDLNNYANVKIETVKTPKANKKPVSTTTIKGVRINRISK